MHSYIHTQYAAFFILAKDVDRSPLYISGVFLSCLGGYLFAMAKYYQSLPTGPRGIFFVDSQESTNK
jgi:hypothetical protein